MTDRDTRIETENNDTTTDENPDRGRRRLLTGGAAGLAALAVGAAGADANTKLPERYPWQSGRNAERFASKVVLITGATSGIGESTARAFAAEGAKVFFCGRREKLGAEVAASIRASGGEATYMRADVREEPQVKAFIDGCVATYGGLDIAFNNAGIEGPVGAYDAIALDGTNSYHDVIATNLNGVFYSIRHELPVMRAQGHGVIINTASIAGSTGIAGMGAYAAAKHGVRGLTRSFAKVHGREGIRILTVSPGGTDTPLMRRIAGNDLSGAGANNPSGRIAQPEEIAAMVLNMAAPEAGYVNGADIIVDGGATA